MEVGGRNEAARRRQSIALEKQRTYSTVEHHINLVKHSKDKEENRDGNEKNSIITEERTGNNVDVKGQQGGSGDVEDIESALGYQPDENSGNLNMPNYEEW